MNDTNNDLGKKPYVNTDDTNLDTSIDGLRAANSKC